MLITVPAVPEGLHPAGCWRRLLTGLNPEAAGGFRALGQTLYAADRVELPEGSLVLAVDKATRGWEDSYTTGNRYRVEDATVTVYLASGEDLAEVWSRRYVSSKSAFGATTMKKLAALLKKHPAPGGEPAVVHEARRPNSREERCRWCRALLPAGRGHVVGHGPDAQVEHYESCPTGGAKTGEVCALCKVAVVGHQAALHYRRDGAPGDTEVRHRPVNGRTCLEQPVASAEEQAAAAAERVRAERERLAQQRRQQEKKEAARMARAAAWEAKKKAEHEAEQARVAGLETVGRVSRSLFDKGLGGGMRVCLREHTDTLEDATTTLRWTVETYAETVLGGGEMGDDPVEEGSVTQYTDLDSARAHYQTLQFEPTRKAPPRRGGRTCEECRRPGASVERQDSSGISGWLCFRCDRENPDDYTLSFA